MGWWKTAKPGDKIVYIGQVDCVDIHPSAYGLKSPKFGKVYTVSLVEPSLIPPSGFGVVVAELPNLMSCVWIYRPVQDSRTEKHVNKFKEFLNKTPVEEVV